jgi:LysR family hydrogen peroxide-inducible transcriptional activator
MPHVTLKQLRYFDALARELHFGRAAEECAVTQPALSMQVQDLEEQLGVALVERTRSGVKLTEKGAQIAKRAERVLGDVRDLIEFAQHSGKLMSGPLRVGVIPSVAPYLLPPLLPLLREEHPELELHVRETQTLQLTHELVEGKLDVLLLALPVTHPDVETLALFEDRFLLALPRARKFPASVRATKDLVEHERLLLLEEGHCLRDQALEVCGGPEPEQALLDIESDFRATSLETLRHMVAAGMGITLMPALTLAGRPGGDDGTRALPFASERPALRRMALCWRRTHPRTKDLALFARFVREHLPAGVTPA